MFRNLTAECTYFPDEVAEAALAHVVGDKVDAADRRGELFEKRRRLMDAWEIHCQTASGIGGAVISLNRGKAPNHIHGYSHIGEVDSL
jgi:hypothetical protein